ncbi:MAG TPA: cobalt transporter CbiM [Dehalococcoidia bacterium]|nr:cobalt transporter CbiM [Dehalococcoidia bacterium]
MHVPDGYLSPATYGVLFATAMPFWMVASQKVHKIISGRTVPLLAIFSAFTFAIMMFNVPVPGGTTAHAAGGTLVAIVLGPWAAVITTSVALVIQALFFGDGGITAIGANCFNMGIALPMTGYLTYRIIAGESDMLSQRRVVAAVIGSYVGITVAALLVGVELGVQPLIAQTDGIPDYSPYGLKTAIPSMLLSHVFGASLVEAAVTGLAVAYLQKSFPEIVLRRQNRTPEVQTRAQSINPWRPLGLFVAIAAVAVAIAGLIEGQGKIDHWAGLDWTTVNWSAAGQTVLVSAIASVILLPALFLLMRKVAGQGARAAGLLFVGLMVWAPIGLIAPGGAFGEDESATQQEVTTALEARARGDSSLFDALPDVNRECACVPNKINDVTYASQTVFAGYQPPWVKDNDSAWKQNVGYQIAGLAGLAMLAGLGLALWGLGRWLMPTAPPDWRNA